ncbi:MAG: hypothetical protein Terrestrivirus5_183 [Terrestrivirus sp.]|uniref:Uncharacterized protein n=1 Tax=Terrestrivirus sp. TaxID=2487775 RepID=A0A3G4ZQU7_9VIRU|nr:MAG: hypothetical protein Terrestrivirus5_183 [Terrestrivirus sp.]
MSLVESYTASQIALRQHLEYEELVQKMLALNAEELRKEEMLDVDKITSHDLLAEQVGLLLKQDQQVLTDQLFALSLALGDIDDVDFNIVHDVAHGTDVMDADVHDSEDNGEGQFSMKRQHSVGDDGFPCHKQRTDTSWKNIISMKRQHSVGDDGFPCHKQRTDES